MCKHNLIDLYTTFHVRRQNQQIFNTITTRLFPLITHRVNFTKEKCVATAYGCDVRTRMSHRFEILKTREASVTHNVREGTNQKSGNMERIENP